MQMWIGAVPEKGKNLIVQTKTGTGVKVSGNGIDKVTMEIYAPDRLPGNAAKQ